MKKLTFIALIISLFFFSFDNPVGKMFPDLSGKKLDGTVLSIPKDTKGKFTILSFAYSKKAEDDLKTWYKPLYNKFVKKPAKGAVFAFETYDVNLYFVPMFTGVKQSAAGNAKKKMKQGVTPGLQKHILIFSGKLKKYKKLLGLEKKDEPYLYVLDETGKVVYKTSGAFSQRKLDDIEDEIEPAD